MRKILLRSHNNKDKKSLFIKSLVSFSIVFLLFLTLSPKADAAISNVFPRAETADSSSVLAVSSKAGSYPACSLASSGTRYSSCTAGSTGLDATETYFKLFRLNPKYGGPTNAATVTLKGACSNPYGGNKGNTDITAQAIANFHDGDGGGYGWVVLNNNAPVATRSGPEVNNAVNCSGTDLNVHVPFGAFTDEQQDRYTDRYLTALIRVKKTGGNSLSPAAGTMHFRVIAPANIYVTFDDLGDRSYDENYPGFGAFALDDANPNGPAETRFRFIFEPDCKLRQSPVHLKWSDADDRPGQANYDGDIGWTLTGSGKNVSRGGPGDTGSNYLGGQSWSGASRQDIGTLILNMPYTWTWTQVNNNNGVQLWIPFSEGMSLVRCGGGGTTRAASCDVTVHEPGLPPFTIIAGQPFTVNATFTNTGGMTLLVGIYPGAPGPPYPANANSSFNYGIAFHNNDPRSYWYLNPPNQYHNYRPNTPTWLNTNETVAFPINGTTGSQLRAPPAPGSYTINFYPDHLGFGGAGGFIVDPPQGKRCPITLNVVQGFSLTPNGDVDLLPDSEYPSQANYRAWIVGENVPSNPVVRAQSSHALWRKRNGVADLRLTPVTPCTPNGYYVDGPRNWPSGDTTVPPPHPVCGGQPLYGPHSQALNPNDLRAGDEICVQVNVHIGSFSLANGTPPGSRAIGYVTASGAIGSSQFGSAMTGCQPIVNLPYLSSYGADVVSGGGFEGTGNTCTSDMSKSTINAYHKFGANGRGGSGGKFAAIALGVINGFVTTNSRISPGDAQPYRGLAFANTTHFASAGVNRHAVGGNYGQNGSTLCAMDYWGKTRFPAGDPNLVVDTTNLAAINNVGSLPSNKQTYYSTADTELLIGGGTMSPGQRHTVYVNGDVFIQDDITYNTFGWNISSGNNNLPSFALIVKGNIYISPNVRQLDGLYVAQPSSVANTGKIYTCAAGIGNLYTEAPGANSIWENCGGEHTAAGNPDDRRLYVNGAFVAKFVHFLRGSNSLRDSTNNEPLGISRASEIFSYSPEMYLSNPVFIDRNGNTLNQRFSSDYDYIVTLPPVL